MVSIEIGLDKTQGEGNEFLSSCQPDQEYLDSLWGVVND